MTVDFKTLEQIPQILDVVVLLKTLMEQGNLEKRWFNTNEVAQYTGYKLETIKSKIKKNDFIQGVHYFKRDGKLLFDKVEIDNWVMGIKSSNNLAFEKETTEDIVNGVLSSIAS